MKLHLVALMMFAAAFAGCTDTNAGSGQPRPGVADETGLGNSTGDVGDLANNPKAMTLTVEPLPPTEADQVRLVGFVATEATLSVEASRAGTRFFSKSVDVQGSWSLNITALPHGRTLVVVTADDGTATQRTNLTVIRLAAATMTATFAAAVPPRAALNETVLVDVDAFLSAPQYVGQPIEHPPYANVHDVMETWNATRPIVFSFHPSFGAGVESIDGYGALSDWCYDLNGASAPLGITGMEFHPGDVIAWHGCAVV